MSFSMSLRRSRLDGGDLDRATQLVHDERRERLTLDLFGDDEQRLARARDLLEHRQQVLHAADALFVDQDERVVEADLHAVRVRHEVRRQVAAVELHALDHVQRGLHALRLFNRDDALFADLLHGVGNDLADELVAVGADCADLGDVLLALRRLRQRAELLDDRLDRLVDAALELDRAVASRNHARALAVDRLREHRGRRRAVARDVGGLRSDLLDHLGAHVLELVLELDLLRDGHAVLRHRGRAPRLLDDDVATARAERGLHGVGEDVDAVEDLLAAGRVKQNVFGCHWKSPLTSRDYFSMTPRISSSRRIR
jgi:hypothetical protein